MKRYEAKLTITQTPEQAAALFAHVEGLLLDDVLATLCSITRLMGVLTIVASAFDAGKDGAK